MFTSLRTNVSRGTSTVSDATTGRRMDRRTPLQVEGLEGRQLLNRGGLHVLFNVRMTTGHNQVQTLNSPGLLPLHQPGTGYILRGLSPAGLTTTGHTPVNNPPQKPTESPLLPVYTPGTNYILR
jgi:hypothetical protein